MIERTLHKKLKELAGPFPVVFVTGPRQSGKTTLCRYTFPDYRYLSLEDLQTREEAMEDPRGFLAGLEGASGIILDEVQRTPDLFSYLQGFVDDKRSGPVILTGSQHFLLTDKISQTLAGRAAVLELLPFSLAELQRREARSPDEWSMMSEHPGADVEMRLDDLLFSGMFPPIHDRKPEPADWLNSYLRTYVERDIQTMGGVGDLDAFTRFLGLCAGRTGQLINASSLGGDAGLSHVTVKKWLSILRAGYVIDILRPHHENFSKRLVKTPKFYFTDTGLLCRLLGLRKAEDLHLHPLRGAIFENFVVSELRKTFLHHGEQPPLFFWRDSNGREVDIIIDLGSRRIPVEIKAGQTISRSFFKGLQNYMQLSGASEGILVYGGDRSYLRSGYQVRSWTACS